MPVPTHLLLPMLRWGSAQRGPIFQVGDRRHWDFVLSVARVSAGGAMVVEIQSSPLGDEASWETLIAFSVVSAPGVFTKTTRGNSPDFQVAPNLDVVIRAVITTIIGEVACELRAYAPFFDLTVDSHAEMLSKELREWSGGLSRTVDLASEDIIQSILADPENGYLDLDLERPGATEAVRREIALQADHNYRRAVLQQSASPAALVTLRELSRGAPGRMERLRPFRRVQGNPWYGR